MGHFIASLTYSDSVDELNAIEDGTEISEEVLNPDSLNFITRCPSIFWFSSFEIVTY